MQKREIIMMKIRLRRTVCPLACLIQQNIRRASINFGYTENSKVNLTWFRVGPP
jgi:metal-sulfur cluster biosynthetic enzyme